MLELVGREKELGDLKACLKRGRNVLLEGPVGVGKTHLALKVTSELGRPVFRVDGDARYSEQKLTGWFDPPTVLKTGYVEGSFVPGPLVQAMKQGGILFINELNRLPEGVQNVLLPAIDEGMVQIPRLGEVRAAKGFCVIATQNPKEFVATSHLSEALLDRFEWVSIDYPSESDETAIVSQRLVEAKAGAKSVRLAELAVKLARLTRSHPRVKRGASVRAALAVAEISQALMEDGLGLDDAFLSAVLLALPTRIELHRDHESDRSYNEDRDELLREWVKELLKEFGGALARDDKKDLKKKS